MLVEQRMTLITDDCRSRAKCLESYMKNDFIKEEKDSLSALPLSIIHSSKRQKITASNVVLFQ